MVRKLILGIIFASLFVGMSRGQVLAAVTFSLSPATQQINNGSDFRVDIILDTGSSDAVGAAALINFDKDKLEGTNLEGGTIFSQPLASSIDQTNGIIKLDYGTLQTAFKGSGTFGSITFKAKNTGTASVNFVFNPSATANSSLVASPDGKNILTAVNNGNYSLVSGGGGGATPTPTPTPSGSTGPETGFTGPTIFSLMGGVALILLAAFSLLRI